MLIRNAMFSLTYFDWLLRSYALILIGYLGVMNCFKNSCALKSLSHLLHYEDQVIVNNVLRLFILLSIDPPIRVSAASSDVLKFILGDASV